MLLREVPIDGEPVQPAGNLGSTAADSYEARARGRVLDPSSGPLAIVYATIASSVTAILGVPDSEGTVVALPQTKGGLAMPWHSGNFGNAVA